MNVAVAVINRPTSIAQGERPDPALPVTRQLLIEFTDDTVTVATIQTMTAYANIRRWAYLGPVLDGQAPEWKRYRDRQVPGDWKESDLPDDRTLYSYVAGVPSGVTFFPTQTTKRAIVASLNRGNASHVLVLPATLP